MRENFERDEYVFKIYAPICSLYFANVVIRRREKLKNNIYTFHISLEKTYRSKGSFGFFAVSRFGKQGDKKIDTHFSRVDCVPIFKTPLHGK